MTWPALSSEAALPWIVVRSQNGPSLGKILM